MADKICCIPGCGKSRLDNEALHAFPKPDTDADRFRTWLYSIGGEILALDTLKIYNYRKVCGKHFELKYHTRGGRLSANAVPTLHLTGLVKVGNLPPPKPPQMNTNPTKQAPGTPSEAKLGKRGNPLTSKPPQVTTGPSCSRDWTLQILDRKSAGQAKSKVKRARLDETVSPSGDFKWLKIKNSNVTQAKSYGAAVATTADIQFGVTSPTTGYISREMAERIEEELEQAIIRAVMGADDSAGNTGPIAFCGKPTYTDGCLHLACMNTKTLEWATRVVERLDIKGVAVLPARAIPKKVRCGFVLPKRWGLEQSLIGKCLQLANPELRPERWLLNGIYRQESTGSTFVVVSVPEDIVPAIMAKGRRLSFLTGSIPLRFRNAKGKFVEYPPSSNPSKPSGVDTASIPTDTTPDTHTDAPPSEDFSLDFAELGLEDVICEDGVPF